MLEPLVTIITNNLVMFAIYAREHNLIDKPGWKRLARLAK